MRKLFAVASAAVLFQTASLAQAEGLSFNIKVGGPPIVISQPPDFIYPSELGFGVAVGVPYDMFYSSGSYYIYRGGGWYRTSSYGGSWLKIGQRQLPPELRKYNINKIHAFRDREYSAYSKDREHYKGKRFNPGAGAREGQRDMKAPAHEGRQGVPEKRPEERGGERKE